MSQLTASLRPFPSMTTERVSCAVAVVNGRWLCAVGGRVPGMVSIELNDVVNGGQWTQAPTKMSIGRHSFAAAAIGNSVYVAGGSIFLTGGGAGGGDGNGASAETFDVETGLWRTLPSMSTKRDGCAGVAVGDEFFVFGGDDDSAQTLNTAESFHVKTGRWVNLPPMNTGRCHCAAAIINNKIYVVGGCDATHSSLDTVEVFDLTTRTWTLLPNRMTTVRSSCAAAAVGRYLVVAGGRDNTSYLNTMEVYDVDTEVWTELPPMSTERWGCAAVSLGGSVFVMGGRDENWRTLDSVEEIPFSDDVVKRMLVEWSGGSWSDEVVPLLHRRTSVVHKLDIVLTSVPILLGRVGQEARLQTVYEILRGDMGIFENTWRPTKGKSQSQFDLLP